MTTKGELLRAIRINCGVCMGMSGDDFGAGFPEADVAGCTSPDCQMFEFRFGKDPYPDKTRSRLMQEKHKNKVP